MSDPNYILITIDSCRWDTFEEATLPFLKSAPYERCWTQATFTLGAHAAFFVGKLPHSFSGARWFDHAAPNLRSKSTSQQIWRLANPESYRSSIFKVEGRSLKQGFQARGYCTLGTGAMNWFDPNKPATEYLIQDFEKYAYFPNRTTGDGRNLRRQVDFSLDAVAGEARPYFLFMNIGETHHRYTAEGHDLIGEWGDAQGCAAAQRASLEFVDAELQRLFAGLDHYLAVICSDHGDCWGEDGLWGHGFYHQKVMEVPMVVLDRREGFQGKEVFKDWLRR